MAIVSGKHSPRDNDPLTTGAGDYLADMILEVQQLALKMGAGGAAIHLQNAYLELQVHRRQLSEPRRSRSLAARQ